MIAVSVHVCVCVCKDNECEMQHMDTFNLVERGIKETVGDFG